jgi:hypothetical protein
MAWSIIQTQEFEDWYLSQDEFTQLKVRESIERLKELGPGLGRPDVDKLKGSKKVKNLKELRVSVHDRPCRIFFAFTPDRSGLLLCAGFKDGSGSKFFYKKYIKIAEKLYSEYTR